VKEFTFAGQPATQISMPVQTIKDFLQQESSGGLLIITAAIFAMGVENSPLQFLYNALLDTPVGIQFGALIIHKPLLLWINDGLMAVFFFLIGLEIKREFIEGELSDPSRVVLPAIAAVGGMAVPALIYVGMNQGDAGALAGWAIPTATDIAFALGVLSLFGNRIPHALKLFLLTLAVLDDLGAIIIIAVFYSGDLSLLSLGVAAVAIGVLLLLNLGGVTRIAPYILVGIVLWVSVLKSGVHATLAGVLLAMFIPLHDRKTGAAPLQTLEHTLHPYVALLILPLFAFANTGINLSGLTLDSLLHPVPLGIALALVIGKQVGVFGLSWLAIRLRISQLPSGSSLLELYGVAALCGIGFTMSLFISGLAAEQTGLGEIADDRLGILLGSLVSAGIGYFALSMALRRRRV
jgi:NhaA family Na+:H+ antiporter